MTKTLRIYDPWLFAFAVIATCLGLLFIFDAGFARAIQGHKSGLPGEFQQQILFVVVALFVTRLAASIPIDAWKKWSKVAWLVNVGLLLLVIVAGHTYNGAKRWIGVPPVLIQPAEFAKLAAVLYLAGYLADRKAWPKQIKPQKNFFLLVDNVWFPKIKRCLPAVWVFLAVALVEFEKDLGTGAVIAATGFAMFIPAGVTRKSILFALGCALLFGGIAMKKEPYRVQRFAHHTQRWSGENIDDIEFQTVQAEFSISSGGILGVGLGAGRAKDVLPATTTDFIWATIGEEFGLWGSFVVLGVLGAIVFRLLYLAQKTEDRFNRLLLFGVGSWIGIQTCVNVMMANAFLPAIGIPLPFISSGGSSLIALWMALGACQATLAPARPKKEKPQQVKAAPKPGYVDLKPTGLAPSSKLSRRRVVAAKADTRRPVGRP